MNLIEVAFHPQKGEANKQKNEVYFAGSLANFYKDRYEKLAP
jgi:hypothetical protein